MGVLLRLTRFPVMDNCVFLLDLTYARLVVSEILPTTLTYFLNVLKMFWLEDTTAIDGSIQTPI